MNLEEKIKEIRQQPENIRLRYVWGAVIISMFFIVIIWILSLKTNSINNNSQNDNTICSPGENCFENINNSNLNTLKSGALK